MLTYKNALGTKDFVISAELSLHAKSDREDIQRQSDVFRDYVDAALVGDNQSGQLHMSSLSAAIMLQNCGIDPIMQLSCRNRNRIAILSDLLGAGAHDIQSLQLIRGERVPDGFNPRPKAVLDISATELLATAKKLTEEAGSSGFESMHLGGVVTAHAPKANWEPLKLLQKVDAGAEFLLTHICMDTELLRAYMQKLVSMKVLHRVRIIVSVAVLHSAKDARWLRENKPNVLIPKNLVTRLERATDQRKEGIAIATEILQLLADTPGVSGAHLYSATDISAVSETIANSGVR